MATRPPVPGSSNWTPLKFVAVSLFSCWLGASLAFNSWAYFFIGVSLFLLALAAEVNNDL